MIRRAFLKRMMFAALAAGFVEVSRPFLRWQPDTLWVDDTRGDDFFGDGSFERPLATLEEAFARIAPLGCIYLGTTDTTRWVRPLRGTA